MNNWEKTFPVLCSQSCIFKIIIATCFTLGKLKEGHGLLAFLEALSLILVSFGSHEQHISSLTLSSLMHAKSAFVEERLAPGNRTHAIYHIGFQFSTQREPVHSQAQQSLQLRHLQISVPVSQKQRLVFPYERQMPLKLRGANS